MKIILLPILIIAGMQIACNNNSQDQKIGGNDTIMNSEKNTVIHQEIKGHDENATEVKLNNGERWVANTETTQGINQMISILKNSPADPKPEDFTLLKQKLETEFNLILQRCTMNGEAHVQLHNYLMPMGELIQDLQSDNIETSGTNLKKLTQHLNEYPKYFN